VPEGNAIQGCHERVQGLGFREHGNLARLNANGTLALPGFHPGTGCRCRLTAVSKTGIVWWREGKGREAKKREYPDSH
jgi:hypothetical protein